MRGCGGGRGATFEAMRRLLVVVAWLLGRGLLAGPAWGQQLLTVGGEEFIDTTSARPAGCPPLGRVRYYQVGGKYPRSSATLVAGARAFLQQQGPAAAGSGYVTFRFYVDCRGRRLPRTQVLQTTPTYQPCHFGPALVAALYGYLQTLTEWPIAKGPQPTNYVSYLTFKLQNGNVVAVVP